MASPRRPIADEPVIPVPKPIDAETGEAVDTLAVERAGVAFDPMTQHLDLTKDEKRRTTSIMLAVQAYRELIIREAAYLEEVARLARNGEIQGHSKDAGPFLRPATIDAMVEAAYKFDCFIQGAYHEGIKQLMEAARKAADPKKETRGGAATEAAAEEK